MHKTLILIDWTEPLHVMNSMLKWILVSHYTENSYSPITENQNTFLDWSLFWVDPVDWVFWILEVSSDSAEGLTVPKSLS